MLAEIAPSCLSAAVNAGRNLTLGCGSWPLCPALGGVADDVTGILSGKSVRTSVGGVANKGVLEGHSRLTRTAWRSLTGASG
ncbi:unnamed protein product [Prunus armeniaca]